MMKQAVVNIFFFLIVTMVFSQSEEAFQRGNSLYNQEKYQEAINAYTTIIKSGEESVELYYNLGNAHYKLNNIAPSIYYYEKALSLAPNDPDVRNNLTFAKNATIDVIDVIPQGFVTKTMDRITNRFTFDTWAWISIFGVVLFVSLFIIYTRAYASLRKRIYFMVSLFSLFVGIFAVIFAFKQYRFQENNQYAIIFAQETTVKSEPNLRSDEVFELHEGTKVKVTDTVNDWKKIRLADGKIGWIPATDLREL